MLKKNLNIKMKMKEVVGGGEVKQEVVCCWMERRETETSRGCEEQHLKTKHNLYTHSFNPRLSGGILFCSFKI